MGYFFQEVLLLWTGANFINKNIVFFQQVVFISNALLLETGEYVNLENSEQISPFNFFCLEDKYKG